MDVVFVLMLFFMTCAVFQPQALTLQAALANPTYGRTQETTIKVTIASDGEVYLQDKLMAVSGERNMRLLAEWLQNAREGFGASDPVVMFSEPSVKHDRVMAVLNAVNAAGCQKVSFR